MIDQYHLDLGYLIEGEDRIAGPIARGDATGIEPHLFLQSPARSLDDAPFDLVPEAVRVDDLPGIGSRHHARQAHGSIAAIHDTVGDQRDIAFGGFVTAECDTAP